MQRCRVTIKCPNTSAHGLLWGASSPQSSIALGKGLHCHQQPCTTFTQQLLQLWPCTYQHEEMHNLQHGWRMVNQLPRCPCCPPSMITQHCIVAELRGRHMAPFEICHFQMGNCSLRRAHPRQANTKQASIWLAAMPKTSAEHHTCISSSDILLASIRDPSELCTQSLYP